jgi:Zn-dependent protease
VNPSEIILWGLAVLVLLRAIQYVLLARTYLTCAARRLSVEAVDPESLDQEDREILDTANEALARAGYSLLFAIKTPALLTLYEQPEYFRVYASKKQPVRAEVRRRMIPEAGALVTVQLETPLESGRRLVTTNFGSAELLTLPDSNLEAIPGAELVELERRHMERVTASDSPPARAIGDPAAAMSEVISTHEAVNQLFRDKGYTTPTADPALDRFTLRGAFGLAHMSLRAAARSKRAGSNAPAGAPTQDQLRLRAVADARALLGVAQHPVRAPGSSAAIWVIMAATAALSFAGMSYLWSPLTAVVILAVIAFHEAGHAIAMRQLGYRDVNVFFVPLLGALTIGRDTGASVRSRLRVMLAGPVPGLWLAVVLLLYQMQLGHVRLLTPWIVALFFINVLNLLPITPFDGGRALELLTRPDGNFRVVMQALSGLALLALGARFGDAVLIILGVLWLGLVRRQYGLYKLRRAVAAGLVDRSDRRAVVETVCRTLASPAYVTWRGAARFATARAVSQQFSDVPLAPGDQLHGALVYASAWIPALIALALWTNR